LGKNTPGARIEDKGAPTTVCSNFRTYYYAEIQIKIMCLKKKIKKNRKIR